MTFQRFAPAALALGTILAASIPTAALAEGHGGRDYRGHGSAGRYDGRRGFSKGPGYYGGGYLAPRVYRRPVYRGYYGGGVYLGTPYGYAYPPSYVYGPSYSYDPGIPYAPAAPQACSAGGYDQYGVPVPAPDCNSGPSQYPSAPQNYDPNQQQYPQEQPQSYYPNQQQYSQPQQNYYPNPPQRYRQ